MTDTTTGTTTINVANKEAFEKYVRKLNRKAVRLNVEPIIARYIGTTEVIQTITEVVEGREYSKDYPVTAHTFELNGIEVFENGWRIVATITPIEEGGHFVDALHGAEVDQEKYGARPTTCDHCNTNRHRNMTYVIRHEDGREMQVGKNCLKELLSGHSAAAMEFRYHLFILIQEADDGELWGSSGAGKPTLISVKACVQMAEAIRITDKGWTYNQRDEWGNFSTEGTHRIAARFVRREDPQLMHEYTRQPEWEANVEQAGELAEEIADAWENIEIEDDNEFAAALSYLMGFEYIPASKAGLAAYAGQFIRQIKEKEEREAKRANMRHVGEVKKRQDFELTCRKVLSFDSHFGVVNVNIFEDQDGNELVWKSSTYRFDEGSRVTLKATVKEHTEYRGSPQTIITRGKVVKKF